MQPLTKHRELSTGGVVTSTAFSISMKDQAHIKSILRDTLYSDKIMAVLREYSANAWDAHRTSGKADRPIKVVLPTVDNPLLTIQDWGTGLSHEDVFEVFAKYGASTKREDNQSVGMLGIGSKSGFAYADTFTIVSCHGGKQRTYVALLDESENDAISLLSEVDSLEEPGISIQIAVKPEDIVEFEHKARHLFKHFNPQPDINIELPKPPAIRAKLKHGVIYDQRLDAWNQDNGKGRWFAIMGCVPYRVDLDQLKDSAGEPLVSTSFRETCGLLNFDIGQIQINASREDLKYSKITKDALVQKFNDLLDEYVAVVLAEIEKGTGTNWEKRVQAQVLLRLGLGKKEIGEWGLDRIGVKEYKTFSINHRENGHTSSMPVTSDTRLLRYLSEKIGRRGLGGFKLKHTDYLVVPKFFKDAQGNFLDPPQRATWDEIETELTATLIADKNDGIKIENLHDLPWEPKKPRKPRDSVYNSKHHVRTFELSNSRLATDSDGWNTVQRDPTDDDVFVILSHFHTCNVAGQNFNLYGTRTKDEEVARIMGITLPPLYGYKTTEKRPVTVAECKGTHYPVWRKKFYKELKLTPKLVAKFQAHHWSRAIPWRYSYDQRPGQAQLDKACQLLGRSHPIAIYLQTALAHVEDSTNEFELEFEFECGMRALRNEGIVLPTPECEIQKEELKKVYPLLDNFSVFWSGTGKEWARYVRLIDIDLQAAMWQKSIEPQPIPEDEDPTPEKDEENEHA